MDLDLERKSMSGQIGLFPQGAQSQPVYKALPTVPPQINTTALQLMSQVAKSIQSSNLSDLLSIREEVLSHRANRVEELAFQTKQLLSAQAKASELNYKTPSSILAAVGLPVSVEEKQNYIAESQASKLSTNSALAALKQVDNKIRFQSAQDDLYQRESNMITHELQNQAQMEAFLEKHSNSTAFESIKQLELQRRALFRQELTYLETAGLVSASFVCTSEDTTTQSPALQSHVQTIELFNVGFNQVSLNRATVQSQLKDLMLSVDPNSSINLSENPQLDTVKRQDTQIKTHNQLLVLPVKSKLIEQARGFLDKTADLLEQLAVNKSLPEQTAVDARIAAIKTLDVALESNIRRIQLQYNLYASSAESMNAFDTFLMENRDDPRLAHLFPLESKRLELENARIGIANTVGVMFAVDVNQEIGSPASLAILARIAALDSLDKELHASTQLVTLQQQEILNQAQKNVNAPSGLPPLDFIQNMREHSRSKLNSVIGALTMTQKRLPDGSAAYSAVQSRIEALKSMI